MRYRGYYYDTDSGFYYLQSRYYDSTICRFINADVFTSTGQDFLGHNMFAYCGNNPVGRADSSGDYWNEVWSFIESVVSEIDYAIGVMSSVYAGCGGMAIAGATLLTVGVIGYGVYQAVQAPSISIHKAEEKTEPVVAAKKPDVPAFFPVDPFAFNSAGLVAVHRSGTKNGSFISWLDPLTNTEVFRWDENPNYSNGPHYHIYGSGHYYPGMVVPEPYSSIYFPFR